MLLSSTCVELVIRLSASRVNMAVALAIYYRLTLDHHPLTLLKVSLTLGVSLFGTNVIPQWVFCICNTVYANLISSQVLYDNKCKLIFGPI